MNDHHFNVQVAIDFDPETAIFLNNMAFWLSKTIANRKHLYENNFWIYNSMAAFTEIFPYWTEKQVRRIIDNAIDHGLIIKGNFNIKKYDRTQWYAFTDKAYTYYNLLHAQYQKALQPAPPLICPNGRMDLPKRADGSAQTGGPIPYSNPDNNLICVGEASAHTNLKELKKEKAEQSALDSPEAKEIFKAKFTGRDVSLQEIFDDCKEHYEHKSAWATKQRFIKWLTREKADNYKKIEDDKKESIKKLFTEEEMELLGLYRHWHSKASKISSFEKYFPNAEKREKILNAVAKEEELKCAQNVNVKKSYSQ